MKITTFTLAILITLLTLFLASTTTAQPIGKSIDRKIIPVKGNLYRFKNNNHFSVFFVTPDGVIATDPINKEAAQWLKAEIKRRFNQPIKYLILSHDHPDHSSGGEVFTDDGAIVIAHKKTKQTILNEQRPTATPEITYEDKMTIELGGKTVNLIYIGKNSSDNTTIMHFPEQRAIFAVDLIVVNRLPYQTMKDAYFPEWFESIDQLALIDFDTLIPGHGKIGNKQDAINHGQYLKDLYAAVQQGIRKQQSLEELKNTIKLKDYQGWGQYKAWLPLNIEGMYNNIIIHYRSN